METREAYRKKTEAKLMEWEANLKILQAKAQSKYADAAIQMNRGVQDLKDRNRALRDVAEDQWESARETLNRGLDDLKRQYNEIRKKLSGPRKGDPS